MLPSPTLAATRFIQPCTRGQHRQVGGRGCRAPRKQNPPRRESMRPEPLRLGLGADEDEKHVGRKGLFAVFVFNLDELRRPVSVLDDSRLLFGD